MSHQSARAKSISQQSLTCVLTAVPVTQCIPTLMVLGMRKSSGARSGTPGLQTDVCASLQGPPISSDSPSGERCSERYPSFSISAVVDSLARRPVVASLRTGEAA